MSRTRIAILAAAGVATLALAGCGGSDPQDAAQPPAAAALPAGTGAGAPAPVAEKRVEITVVGNEVQGGLMRVPVAVGTPVTLVVTCDHADEAHLHGYDRKVELVAGQPGTISFTADTPGVFSFELHGADVQMARIEVS